VKVVITGASGLIGTALVRDLRGDGHDVLRLVRHAPTASDEAHWDPAHRLLDPAVFAGADAVVHLAGAGVGDKRWTESYRKTILDSRVSGTTTLAQTLAGLETPPAVLVSASAVGFYGDRGDQVLDESSPTGDGFLAEVVRQWEACTSPAEQAGIRVVHIRTGLVLSKDGGVLGKTLPLYKIGLGGRLGSGRQWMPWIALPDEVGAIRFLIDNDSLSGAVNLSAPDPVRNSDYTSAVGRAVHRPTLAAVPRFALRAALAGFADEGALVSQRMVPRRLTDAGFEFGFVDLDTALTALLA
jgi:uncharacterized protein (TIGR01777 family)